MIVLPKFTMLLCLLPVKDMLDVEESKEAVSCVALFESEDEANYMRLGIAQIMPHETRLVLVTVDIPNNKTVTDVLVVMSDRMN